jgi:TPR repeat protein
MPPLQASPNQVERAPGSRTVVLFARGLEAEHRGDISGARRFYLSAAQQGDAAAARNLGRLYDPAYLGQATLGGVDPDPVLAQQWYARAVHLGDPEAGALLEALSVR